MKNSPSIVGIAALIGDQARASMLTTLMNGEALTATELSVEANVTKQTASSHLHKLVDAGLLTVQAQGRHRYYQLAALDVAQMLETLMGVAQRTRVRRRLPGPRDPALRKARVCYDHLAGELAVRAYDCSVRNGLIKFESAQDSDTLDLTQDGRVFFEANGVELNQENSRRAMCRPCLDWSVRRHHLAGQVGRALLAFCYKKRWAKRLPDSRVVKFTPNGQAAFEKTFT